MSVQGFKANLQKSQMVFGRCSQELQLQCLQITRLHESNFPLKYLGIPISASRLTKIECRTLAKKILARVHTWATRSTSFAGRAMLTNSIVFGMFNYWASIFLLPTEVIERITQICRNYLWSGIKEFQRVPHISW